MTDNWDFYACRVDDEPASIFVDLGIAAEAPLADRSFMSYVRLRMRAPRPDGLSSQLEFEELIHLEDHLTGALERTGDTTYVGRNTSGGCRDFYFYTMDPSQWEQRVAVAMAGFAEYEYDTGSRHDKDWSSYFGFLYPGDEDMERIHNRRVCESLQKQGDKLAEEREIDHWAYFPDEGARARFIDHIVGLGFTVRELMTHEEDEGRVGVQFFRIDLPSFQTIDNVTLPLHRAAKEAGGDYDGWETQVVAP